MGGASWLSLRDRLGYAVTIQAHTGGAGVRRKPEPVMADRMQYGQVQLLAEASADINQRTGIDFAIVGQIERYMSGAPQPELMAELYHEG